MNAVGYLPMSFLAPVSDAEVYFLKFKRSRSTIIILTVVDGMAIGRDVELLPPRRAVSGSALFLLSRSESRQQSVTSPTRPRLGEGEEGPTEERRSERVSSDMQRRCN